MTRHCLLVVVILAIPLAPLPAHPQARLGGEWRDDVERFAQSLVEAQLVPGLGIAVTQGDWVVYSRAFGFADAASGRRADEGTAFYIASSTKALTATAVLALSARRELDLDSSIAHYLPALRGRGRLNADSVTLRDLLKMSHGIEGGGQVEFRTAYSGTWRLSSTGSARSPVIARICLSCPAGVRGSWCSSTEAARRRPRPTRWPRISTTP